MGITNPGQEYFKNGSWGWNGTEWIKNGIAFGFYERWVESLGGTKSGAGTWDESSSVVPADEIWVAVLVSLMNNTGARGVIFLDAVVDGALRSLNANPTPIQYEMVRAEGLFMLDAGDYVRVRQFTCLDGDVLKGCVWGYKMKVA